MDFQNRTLLEKLALLVSLLAAILFIFFGLNQILGFLGPIFIGKSFLLSNRVLAGILDLFLSLLIFLIEFELIKTSFVNNYLYRGILYLLFAFVFSTCATIALGGILYIIAYFLKNK